MQVRSWGLGARELNVRLSFGLKKNPSVITGWGCRLRAASGLFTRLRNRKAVAVLSFIVTGGICALLPGCGTIMPGSTATTGSTNVPGSGSGTGSTGASNSGSLVISTQEVSFGNVTVGQTANASLSVSNAGSAPAEITQVQLNGAGFALAGQSSVPIEIAGGASYSLNLSFHPSAAGAETGALTLSTNTSAGTATVALSGTGEAAGSSPTPGLSLSTGNLSFGTVAVGQSATPQTITLTSSGTAALTINAASVSGPEFSLRSGGLPMTLQPGQTAVLTVIFHPTAAGAAAGALTLSTNTSAGRATVALSGTGLAAGSPPTPGLSLSTGNLSFGTVAVNKAATPQTVTLTSSGTASLTIDAASVTGSGFSLTGGSFPKTLEPGQTAVLTIGFDPATTGTLTGVLTVTTNTSSGSATISLSGAGQQAAAAGTLNGLTCTSGSMTGAGKDNCTIALTGPAGSGGMTVSLASSSTAVTVPGAVTVAAGATSAQFAATASGVTTAQAAVLTASSASVTKSYTIQLGAGGPGLTLQSTSVSFGDVALKSPATQTVTLTSSGTAALTISAASVTGTGFSLAGGSFPITLQPGQTATLDIQFDPTAAGSATGVVTLATNASSGTATIALSGTGDTSSSSYEVDLNWNAPADSADPVAGYKVYRAASGSSDYQLLNSNVDDGTTYTDTGVESGMAYTYYVVSVDASGNQSAPSNLFSTTIP